MTRAYCRRGQCGPAKPGTLIATRAGLSEALLYKHFADKQQLFLAVLEERLPRPRFDPDASRGDDLATGLTDLLERLMLFFTASFPISASIFGAPELLAQHRAGIAAHGRGPHEPVSVVIAYLDAERETGRARADADTTAAARALVGAAFHQGFLADARALAGGESPPSSSRRWHHLPRTGRQPGTGRSRPEPSCAEQFSCPRRRHRAASAAQLLRTAASASCSRRAARAR
ncbi:hypothetical protein MIAR_26660 [Microbacterium arabinogalactanolyticum]|nr:hypothetical protein MIAR_26660 [Microbacterium arabinogalactanolyticum]